MTLHQIETLERQANYAQMDGEFDLELKLRAQVKAQKKLYYATECNRKKRMTKLLGMLEDSSQLKFPELDFGYIDQYPE